MWIKVKTNSHLKIFCFGSDGRIPQPVQFLKDVINSSVFNNIFEISDVTEA